MLFRPKCQILPKHFRSYQNRNFLPKAEIFGFRLNSRNKVLLGSCLTKFTNFFSHLLMLGYLAHLATEAAERLVVLPEDGLEAVRRLQVEVDHVDHAEDPHRLVVELPGAVEARLHRVPCLSTPVMSQF